MIMLSDLLLESDRLKRRAYRDDKPVDARRLAILSGAEIIPVETAIRHLENGEGIAAYAAEIGGAGHPGVILVDTGTAARDAMILIDADPDSVEGRALIALALAHSAMEPARGHTIEGVRMVVLTLPDGCERDEQGQITYDVGRVIRHDKGSDINFRPIAEAAIMRLAMSMLISESDVQTTAEWTGTGTEDGRVERLSAMLARRSGIPGDWTETAVRRHMGRALKPNGADRRSVA